MARRKGKKRGGSRRGVRIAGMLGIAMGGYAMIKHAMAASPELRAASVVESLTGYWYPTGNFDWKTARFTVPAVAGAGVSLIASKVGLNRYTPKGINI